MSYTKTMLAILALPDRADLFDNRFGNRSSVPAGRFGDTSTPITCEPRRRSAAPDGSAPMPVRGIVPATPRFQRDAAFSPAGEFFGNVSNGRGLRLRSRGCIFIATLIASQLLFSCIWAAAKSPEKHSHTARIILEIDVDNPSPPVWCYDTEPAFVISKDRTVFRYDTSGKLLWQMSVPWEMGSIGDLLCSNDGKVLYVTNSRGNRLSIYSPENGLSEYEMSAPDFFHQGTMISDDGSTFVLPSAPSLLSGKDVLHDKRFMPSVQRTPFWTKDILFLPAADENSYRMLRNSDLSDLGVVKPRPTHGVQRIVECGKSYFALYWKDEVQRRYLERINDRRLQSNGAPTRFDNVGVVEEFDGSCTVALVHHVNGTEQLKSAAILRDGIQEWIDFSNTRTLIPRFSVSKDRRLMLGIHNLVTRPGEVITGSTPTRVVVLGIERK